jgi:hypothetical protein
MSKNKLCREFITKEVWIDHGTFYDKQGNKMNIVVPNSYDWIGHCWMTYLIDENNVAKVIRIFKINENK